MRTAQPDKRTGGGRYGLRVANGHLGQPMKTQTDPQKSHWQSCPSVWRGPDLSGTRQRQGRSLALVTTHDGWPSRPRANFPRVQYLIFVSR